MCFKLCAQTYISSKGVKRCNRLYLTWFGKTKCKNCNKQIKNINRGSVKYTSYIIIDDILVRNNIIHSAHDSCINDNHDNGYDIISYLIYLFL